jgi:hypothetical protein
MAARVGCSFLLLGVLMGFHYGGPPRNKTWGGRLSQLLDFLLISLVSFLCFIQTFCASPYTNFGFYLSIMAPLVVF